MANYVEVKGARQHNLKDIDVDIPKDSLVVITGLSGSGKSSLAFDTIFAEGQRRYVESLSAYARQFLGVMDKPDVDHIDGLSPAISIDQKSASHNPRSTVGTITEIYDHLRLLYARIGVPVSPETGEPVTSQTVDEMIEQIDDLKTDKIMVLAPIARAEKGAYEDRIEALKEAGYARIRIDGEIFELEDDPEVEDPNQRHNIEIVIDRLTKRDGEFPRSRLSDSLEKGLEEGGGNVIILNAEDEEELFLSEKLYDPATGMNFPDLEPRLFSFNSPYGACPECSGLGQLKRADEDKVIQSQKLSINEGGIGPLRLASSSPSFLKKVLSAVAEEYNFSLDDPIGELSEEALDVILYGSGDDQVSVQQTERGEEYTFDTEWKGIIPMLENRYKDTDSDFIRKKIDEYMAEQACPACEGERLRKEALAVKVEGKSITELTKMPIGELNELLNEIELEDSDQKIGGPLLEEIRERVGFLMHVGLSYLTLRRTADTLAGGEAQRVRLATQIGSGLSGVIYILDEPSIGLHPHDHARLIDTLKELRDMDNTVIVVEHDPEMIKEADHVIDLGPGAGKSGGEVIAEGSLEEIKDEPGSLTGQYMSGDKEIEIPKERNSGSGDTIEIIGATEHNLKNIDVEVPLETFTCVTGLSGSGKSTLVNDILANRLRNELHNAETIPGAHDAIEGIENIDKVVLIDQSPIGRTPRSNAATYTSAFTPIRKLFAQLPEAEARGFDKGRFSFNVKGGRCEHCQGQGVNKVEMHFLPDIFVPCEVCEGKRFNKETLQVKYKDHSIADVLALTVREALNLFENFPKVERKLQTLKDVGLGYLELGQPSTQLSGGEAQRVKLSTELARKSTGDTLYILDEPTTGLHFEDINNLLGVLQEFVDRGNTVLVIEHNLDVIKVADHIIDLGPEGGDKGGEILVQGTPEEVAEFDNSYTGKFLKEVL